MSHLSGVYLPDLNLRRAQDPDDRAQFMNLGRLSFSPLTAMADLEQDAQGRSLNPPQRQGWVVEEKATNQLVGRYRHLELAVFFAGARFSVAGIGGVAVALEHRGQGIAQWMLQQALKEFHQQQIPISMLYPFQHGFYRKLGWASVGWAHQYRISSRDLPLYGSRLKVVSYQREYDELIKSAYHKAAIQHNGWLQRETWHWEDFFQPKAGREIYGYVDSDDLLGYVVIEFRSIENLKQLSVVVLEWVALTAQAYQGILGFLASLRDQISTIVWNSYPDDSFPHLLKERRRSPGLPVSASEFGYTDRFGEIGSGFMWRLVDLKQAFEQRPIQFGESFAIAFDIADPVLGNQHLNVQFANGRMTLTDQKASTVIRLSVEHLCELFSSTRSSRSLHWLGDLEIDGDPTLLNDLDQAWRTTPLFCWDFF